MRKLCGIFLLQICRVSILLLPVFAFAQATRAPGTPTAGTPQCFSNAYASAPPQNCLAGTAIAFSGRTINSNAVEHFSYQPGLITAVVNTKSVFAKFSKASTVDNLEGSSQSFTCAANPVITMYECGTDASCASPTTIGTVTVTAAGTAVDGSVTSPAITAGDYVAFAISSGTCTSLDISAVAQVHSN